MPDGGPRDESPFQARPIATERPGPPDPRLESRLIHNARVLTGDRREAEVMLDGMRYVLRITRQGKLILTK
jgi:hemin uptake protein HemP